MHFNPARHNQPIVEEAFEQIVSRFETFLEKTRQVAPNYGLLIHDNNETVAKRHTQLMKAFHLSGTHWTRITNIIDTPLFVSSELTSMVQLADLCSYALRRYLENAETNNLFSPIYKRADTKGSVVVGVRHFTKSSCPCDICASRRKPVSSPTSIS